MRLLCTLGDQEPIRPSIYIVESGEDEIWQAVDAARQVGGVVVALAKPNYLDALMLALKAADAITTGSLGPKAVMFLVRGGYDYFDVFVGGKKQYGQALGPNHPDNNPAAISKMVLNLAAVH